MSAGRLLFVASLVAVVCTVGLYTVDVEGGADNVLVNPGFEEGLTGWQSLDGSFLLESSNVRSGNAAARLITSSVGCQCARIQQDGTAFAGDWDASVFVSSSVDGLLGELTLEFFDASSTRLVTESTTIPFPSVGYQELSLSLAAPEGTTSFRYLVIARGAPNSVALVDDAFLAGVAGPPPTATETPTPPESPTPNPPGGGDDDDDDDDPELAASLYLRNPTFEIEENGLSRHWRSEGGQVMYTNELARSGFAAGHMVGNLSTPITVSQTVRLLNENTRRFAVYALGSPPGGSVQLEIQWLLLADQPTAEPVRSEVKELDGIGYQEVALVATPPSRVAGAVLTITVVNGSEGDNVRLDDASWRTSRSTTSQSSPNAAEVQSQGSSNAGSSVQRPENIDHLPDSTSGVLVTEVYYAAESGEAEWVELRNSGDGAVVLAGWVLFDNLGSVVLGHTVITSGGYALISSEGNLPSGVDSAILSETGELGNGLANNGDHLILLDQNGALVDSLSWGDDQTIFDDEAPSATAGNSLSRLADEPDTDSSSDFRSASPTPGRGLAGFTGESSDPSTPPDSEDEDTTGSDDSAAASNEDPSSGGIPGWLLMLLIVAAVVVAAGTLGWVRREELTAELGRLRDRWWRF